MKGFIVILLFTFSQNLWSQSDHTVTYILIDGLSLKVFEQELNKGNLPNLQRLISKSTYVEKGIGSFPSMTGYAFYPFITGQKAIESDVLGLRWFDRSQDVGNLRNYVGRTNIWMNQDINPNIKTIFEYFPNDYTTSINSFMNRGVGESSVTGWPLSTAKYQSLPLFKLIKKIPIIGRKNSFNHFEHESLIMQDAIQQVKRNPKVQWVTFPSLDALHHVEGLIPEYSHLLQHIDGLIGAFVDSIATFGQSETRMLAVISDHGISEVHTNHNVPYYLDSLSKIKLRRGASTSIRKQTLDDPLSKLNDVDGYYVVNGDLIGYIYLRNPRMDGSESWRKKISYDDLISYKGKKGSGNLIDLLCQLEGVSFISYLKKGIVCIKNKEGEGQINKSATHLTYTITGKDPLQYSNSALYNTALNEKQWLDKTIHTNYPMAVPKIFDLMTHPKMGDLLLCTHPGYDLAADYEILIGNYKGGHGDIRSDLTIVPYIIYIPNQDPTRIDYTTSTEIGKMVFKWMGIKL